MCNQLEISKILKVTTCVLAGARFRPDHPVTLSVITVLFHSYRRPLEQWNYDEFVACLAPVYEKNICGKEEFRESMDLLARTQVPTDHIDCIRRFANLLILLFDQALNLYHSNQFEQLAALLDGIHGLPEALISRTKWNPTDYWTTYLLPYRAQWDHAFLKEQQPEFFPAKQIP